jgi:Transcriptional regulator, AbiEi antitoxin N-terminal domain
MKEQGYSHDLQQRYKKSNWLKSVGTGAFIRSNDKVSMAEKQMLHSFRRSAKPTEAGDTKIAQVSAFFSTFPEPIQLSAIQRMFQGELIWNLYGKIFCDTG